MQCEKSAKITLEFANIYPLCFETNTASKIFVLFVHAPATVSFPLDGASSFPQPRTEDNVQLPPFL